MEWGFTYHEVYLHVAGKTRSKFLVVQCWVKMAKVGKFQKHHQKKLQVEGLGVVRKAYSSTASSSSAPSELRLKI